MKPMKSLTDYLKDPIKVNVELDDKEVTFEVSVKHEPGRNLQLLDVFLNDESVIESLTDKEKEDIRQCTVHNILQYTYDLVDYREAVKEARHDFQRDA